MIYKVAHFIKINNLLSYNDKVVVGVSGGADSVCLLFVLLKLRKEYNLSIYVVHVNHKIRLDAKEDQEYVQSICKEEGIECLCFEEDVQEFGKSQCISEEEAGRIIRYKAFYNGLEKYNANKIAVAHHKNDQAETVLFNLFRGSGLDGLTGISPMRNEIIRPLLCVTREEIETYLNINSIQFRTDFTNFEEVYTRNKIRLKVLSYIKENINKRAIEHISESADTLHEIKKYIQKNGKECYERIVKEENGQYSLLVSEFKKEDLVMQKEVVRIILKRFEKGLKDITKYHIEQMLELASKVNGKYITLPNQIIALRKYETIIFYKQSIDNVKSDNEFLCVDLKIPGSYYIDSVQKTLSLEVINVSALENVIIPENIYTKWFDYDKINTTVSLRTRKEGDFIIINKDSNKKKLKSFFIDNKIPKEDRDNILLLVEGKHIIWIIGSRISEAYKIDKNTVRILCVKLYGGKENDK